MANVGEIIRFGRGVAVYAMMNKTFRRVTGNVRHLKLWHCINSWDRLRNCMP